MYKTKIIISSHSDFCFGVRRALNIAKQALKKRRIVYSLGPIIHNPQVADEFSKRGLKIIKDVKEISTLPAKGGQGGKSKNKILLIPSHGVSPDILRDKKINFVDTTCPFVAKVQERVRDLRERGYFIIIVGDKRHPEVRGLVGIAGSGCSCVLKDKKEAKAFNFPPVAEKPKKIALISQTTVSVLDFKEILSEIAKKDFKELVSFNTICKNTIDRQTEAQRIARKAEVMIIIGGKNSANTSKLAKACKKINKNTYHIESKKDLKANFFKNKKSIGIATGASTPTYAIKAVVEKIRRIHK